MASALLFGWRGDGITLPFFQSPPRFTYRLTQIVALASVSEFNMFVFSLKGISCFFHPFDHGILQMWHKGCFSAHQHPVFPFFLIFYFFQSYQFPLSVSRNIACGCM